MKIKRKLYNRAMIILLLFIIALFCFGCGSSASGEEKTADNVASDESSVTSEEPLQKVVLQDADSTGQTKEEEIPYGEEESSDETEEEYVVEINPLSEECPANGTMAGEHEKTLEGMQVYLSGLTTEPEQLLKEGGIAISWDSVLGMRNLIAFEELCEQGQEAEIVIMQFTTEGDPILDYLFFDGDKVWHVTDSSRDQFGDPDTAFTQEEFPFLLTFTQKAEERDRLHSVVLAKEESLSYDECVQIQYRQEDEASLRFIASFFYTDADL